jgi:hypothetical protein
MKETVEFERIVDKTVALQGRPFEKRSCPDQYLGTLSEIIGQPVFPLRCSVDQRPSIPSLILVLESPHIDEFVNTFGPAKGYTGEMIRKYLPEAFELNRLGDYGLILLNAIQYQCSLGSNTAVYRDRIFRAVWAQGGKENFQYRFKGALQSSDLVMNCCTKGNDFEIHPPLRSLVEDAIRQINPEIQTIKRMHPAAWRNPAWRGKAWRHQDQSQVMTSQCK